MTWGPFLVLLLAFGGASEGKNRALSRGIEEYQALQYAEALQSLTQALDQPSTKRESARIHLYIGLIQHHFKAREDAENSFNKAIDIDAKIRIPKTAPKAAKAMFMRLKTVKLGDFDPEPLAHSAKKLKRRRTDPNSDDDLSAATATVAAPRTVAASPRASVASSRLAASGPSFGGAELRGSRTAGGASAPIGASALPMSNLMPNAVAKNAGVAGANRADLESDLESRSANIPVGTWVSGSIGGAAVVLGATLGILSIKSASNADSELVALRAKALYSTAVQQRTIALVSLSLGAVAVGTAIVLFMTNGD